MWKMHWVTSSLDPDTLTDRSVEPGTRKLNIRDRGWGGGGEMMGTPVANELGVWPKGGNGDHFDRGNVRQPECGAREGCK